MPAELAAAAAASSVRAYPEGTAILVEDARPAKHLYVIRSGSVELLHGDQAIDVLEPGESFGVASVLTALAPAFTVRARDATVCVLVPRD
ncbi:MAG TPA: cyclic nucleotide-binding domain-containing protein, partial [Solirubrobacteraceae bacterium]|nr:cyclic nucleotide-binding domain-containing protein [Solirubrobacteraceae bacterium]